MRTAQTLADRFMDLTDEMEEKKKEHRQRREQLARQVDDKHRAMLSEERALSAQRAQIALEMTLTGHTLDELGRMVGVSGPFICTLARKARKENETSE